MRGQSHGAASDAREQLGKFARGEVDEAGKAIKAIKAGGTRLD